MLVILFNLLSLSLPKLQLLPCPGSIYEKIINVPLVGQQIIETEILTKNNVYVRLDGLIKNEGSIKYIESNLKNDIIFDIDWQGTKQLANHKNLNLIKIYLITDNKEELKKRLINRNQNTNEEIEMRFKSFDEDVKHWKDYDYIIINKNLEVCFNQIEKIITSYKNNLSSSFRKVQ